RRLAVVDEPGPQNVLRLLELLRRDPVGADAVELLADEAVQVVDADALVYDAEGDPHARAVARATGAHERAGAEGRLFAPYDGDVEARAFSRTQDQVQQLQRRRVRVAVLGDPVEPQRRVEVRLRVAHFAPPRAIPDLPVTAHRFRCGMRRDAREVGVDEPAQLGGIEVADHDQRR